MRPPLSSEGGNDISADSRPTAAARRGIPRLGRAAPHQRRDPIRTAGPRRLLAVELAVLLSLCLAATCLAATSASATGAGRSPIPRPAASRNLAGAGCPLPLVHESFQGYHIGVPAGWEISSLGGTVEVEANPSGTEATLVYPALLTKGLTPSSFFSAYLGFEERQIAATGGSLSVHEQPPVGGLPRASLSLRSAGADLAGEASVLQLPVHTALASSALVFVAEWAPAAQLPADRAVLGAIASCYGTEPAQLYEVFRDQTFAYILPAGWRVTVETQDGLDVQDSAGTAYVGYLLFGIPPTASTPSEALAYILGHLGVRVTKVLSTYSSPQTATAGTTAGELYEQFLAEDGGKTFHGLVSVYAESAAVGTFGTLRLGMAVPTLWNSFNGGLVEMMGAIQHNYSGDLADIDRLDQQWQSFSGQEADFDDIINGQQLVQDPSTGDYYEAPYSAYDPSGPDGAGYYLNGQLLNIASH